MAKIKKFDVWSVPIEVEYIKPIAGRLFGVFARLKLVRVKRFNMTVNYKAISHFYRLIVPRFVKGGGVDGEQ